MAVIESSVHIDRPLETVFDYAVDMTNELAWNPGVESMQKVTPGPVRLGTRYKAKWRQSGHIDVECTGFERPTAWTYHNGGPVVVDLSIRLTPEGGGTRLVARFEAHPRGLFRVLFPVFLPVMRKQEKANMANLKRAIEALPAAGKPLQLAQG
ncbi:MAG: SRPBCC family protein [Thermoplasmatota archaeon]|nr:SRPBCC family protein [Halobacteriales archaeon]